MNRMAYFLSFFLILSGSIFCIQNEVPTGTGIIRGRVTNAQDQPLQNANIYLMKENIPHGYNPNQTRTAFSDSTGKYEFLNVAEGNYWLAVQPVGMTDTTGRDMLFYFPDKLVMKDSYMFRVGPNAVLTAMDVRCVPGKVGFEAKGRIVESVSRKPVTNMRLVYGQNSKLARAIQDFQTDEKGFFAMSRLNPGKYWAAILHEQSEDYYCYPIYFEIIDSDISDLQITAYKGPSLRGTVVVNNSIPVTFFSDHVVVFRPKGISEANQHPTNNTIESAMEKTSPVSLDGSFVIKGLPPLVGQLVLRRRAGLPLEDQFVVLIEQNGTNLSKVLRVENKDINNVMIRVNTGNGTIRGKVKPVNSIVELKRIGIMISLQNETMSPFIKSLQLDPNGEFALNGLLPGEYSVMATMVLENGLIRRTGDVQVVQLREGETKEVVLPVGN